MLNMSADAHCELPMLQEGGLQSVVRLVNMDNVDSHTLYNCVR